MIYNKIKPQQIGFDIDCVVADTMEAFQRIADDIYNIKVQPEEITQYNVEDCLTIDPKITAAIFERLLADPIKWQLQLLPNAKTVISKLSQHAPINLITARPSKKPIDNWLAEKLGPEVHQQIKLTAMGDHDGKSKFVKDLGLAYFIDDRLESCLEMTKRNIKAIVYSQPWNQGNTEIPYVNNWAEIDQLINYQ